MALPATDEAKQSGALGLLLMFLNPFVYLVALPVLVAGALLAFVLWFALLRSRDLERSVKFVVACVLVAVLACAPLSHGVALSAALAALALGALAARYVPWCERHA